VYFAAEGDAGVGAGIDAEVGFLEAGFANAAGVPELDMLDLHEVEPELWNC
jgi:hypothetical protein